MVLSKRGSMMYMLRAATAVFLSALIKSAVSSLNKAFPSPAHIENGPVQLLFNIFPLGELCSSKVYLVIIFLQNHYFYWFCLNQWAHNYHFNPFSSDLLSTLEFAMTTFIAEYSGRRVVNYSLHNIIYPRDAWRGYRKTQFCHLPRRLLFAYQS